MPRLLSGFGPILYVRISPERLTVRNVKTGEAISEVPEVAIGAQPKAKILAVGAEARSVTERGVEVVNPFAHPRSLISDFNAAEQLLKVFVRRLRGRSLFALSPLVVMHPMGSPLGGFTQVELRAFREMAAGTGASDVIVWVGRLLTDDEVSSRKFPSGAGVAE